jgi:hypothetical protein
LTRGRRSRGRAPEGARVTEPESGPRSRAAEWISRLALLAGSLCVSLLALELVVRFIEPREVLREFFETSDPILHHRLIPGARARQKTTEFDAAYEINSLGLRGPEISRVKPAGTKRLLILGDSFTEGVGVNGNETYASRLQVLLDESRLPSRWQVINAGVASYSPLLEYVYLKHSGLALQPDLVMLALDLSDVFDDVQYERLAEIDATMAPIAVRADPERGRASWPVERLLDLKDLVKTHTRTYNFVRRQIAGNIEAGRNRADTSGDVRFDKYAMLREDRGPASDREWTRTYEHVLRIRDTLKARGIDFWISVYPYGLQVSPREWASGRQFWGFKEGVVLSTRPQQLVAAFGRTHRVPVVDMSDDFRKASETVFPLYYDGDGHWRAAGHRVAAAALHRALVPYLGEARGGPQSPRPLPAPLER